MADDQSTDHGCLLEKEDWAIVFSPKHGFRLYTPKMPPGSEVPPMALTLMACFVRLDNDQDFRSECEQWFYSQKS